MKTKPMITMKRLLFALLFLNKAFLLFAFSPEISSEIISDTTIVEADTSSIDSMQSIRKWTTGDTYISGAMEWTNEDNDKEFEFDIQFGANFIGKKDEIDIKLESDFGIKNGKQKDNEQDLRINWYHTLYKKWHLAGQGRIERNQRTIEGTSFDYLIWLGGLGPGYNLEIEETGNSRISILYNYLQLFVFKGNVEIHTKAPSIYLDNDYQLSKKVNLKNWTSILFYDIDDIGYELETELGYSITEHLAIGLRHYFLYNGPTLKYNKSNELRIFTKITF